MADSAQPSINLGEFLQAAQQYKQKSQDFAGTVGLVFNPMTGEYVKDPNFLDPTQHQALLNSQIQGQTAQLSLDSMNDPAVAARLAGVQNAATSNTFLTPQQQEQIAQLTAQQNALKAASSAAGQLNPATFGIGSLLAKVPGLNGALNQNYSQYQNALAALQSTGFQGGQGLFTPGQSEGDAYKTALASIASQLQALTTPQTYGSMASGQAPMAGSVAPQMAPQAAPVSYAPITPGPSGNPYDATAPQMLSGAQLGARARQVNGGY